MATNSRVPVHPTTPPPSHPSSPSPSSPSLFSPSLHLSYNPPTSILTMSDLCYPSTPLSSLAHTQPFPLLSRSAILEHRREIFSKQSLDNCMHYLPPRNSVQIRGTAPRFAPFVWEFWNSREVLGILSELAGVELVPCLDYEVAHTNVQLRGEGVEGVYGTPVEPPVAEEENRVDEGEAKGDGEIVLERHKDSHPFVCVVMLSDARNMRGGETELLCGDGRTVKIRAPAMGHATLLQGRYIPHTALPSLGASERVTIVTSFRPRNPNLVDDTTNQNTRNESHLPELYYQWSTYRLSVLAQRARTLEECLKARYKQSQKRNLEKGLLCDEVVNIAEMEKWVEEQVGYLRRTLHEMRPLEAWEKGAVTA